MLLVVGTQDNGGRDVCSVSKLGHGRKFENHCGTVVEVLIQVSYYSIKVYLLVSEACLCAMYNTAEITEQNHFFFGVRVW